MKTTSQGACCFFPPRFLKKIRPSQVSPIRSFILADHLQLFPNFKSLKSLTAPNEKENGGHRLQDLGRLQVR